MSRAQLDQLKNGERVAVEVAGMKNPIAGIVVRKSNVSMGVLPDGQEHSLYLSFKDYDAGNWKVVDDPRVRDESKTLLKRLLNRGIPEDLVFYEIAPAIGVVVNTTELKQSGKEALAILAERAETIANATTEAEKKGQEKDVETTGGKGRRRKTRRARKTRRS